MSALGRSAPFPLSARVRATLVLAAVAIAGTVSGGCGVSLQSGAHVVPEDMVPYDLLSPTTSALATSVQNPETVICLPLGETLLVLNRSIAGTPALNTPLAKLQAGATEGESNLGVRSAIEAEDITAVEIDGEQATVHLAEEFLSLATSLQLMAVAQITCTLTSTGSVEEVVFLLDDDEVAVPVADGSLVERPVRRSDYAALILN